ncbi:MAG: sulfite exporter TauE/SafE family protein [Gammaproteobacteria bacterium]|nr:sulfite exporter TauE/SafE family protein [Gammaproteobacteria bacterium]
MMLHLVIYIVAGALVGVMAGLLGLGGGILIIPFLVWQLPQVGVPAPMLMHVAVATSLGLVVCSALVSGWNHHRYGNVQWFIVRRMLIGLVIGAWLGTIIAKHIPSQILQVFFGVFVLIVSRRMAFPKEDIESRVLPAGTQLNIVSVIIGTLCILLGVSGGSLLVPYLNRCNLPLRQAIATSSVCTFPVALTGVTMLMFFVPSDLSLPHNSVGYVYFPALLGLLLPCIALVPVGVYLAVRLEISLIRRIFSILLLLIGCDMIYNASMALFRTWQG